MENKDWREEIRGEWSQEVDNEMPMVFIVDGEEQIAYWWLNKIEALLQSKQEEIEKAMDKTRKEITHPQFALYEKGYNQALEDLKPIISNLFK